MKIGLHIGQSWMNYEVREEQGVEAFGFDEHDQTYYIRTRHGTFRGPLPELLAVRLEEDRWLSPSAPRLGTSREFYFDNGKLREKKNEEE